MSRSFHIGHRRWLYVSIEPENTFPGSIFGHRYRAGNLFLWFGWLRVMYSTENAL